MNIRYFATRKLMLILATGVVCWPMWLRAQVSAQPQTTGVSQSTTELQDLVGVTNPTRFIESRTQTGGTVLETRTTEARSINGGYAPIRVIERETVQVDAITVRVVQRVFGIDPDGKRTLFQVTEENTTKVPDGENVVRTVSNSDLNGRLQVVQRDVESTHTTGSLQETSVTTLRPGPNGFTSVLTRRQTTEQQASGATHSTATVSIADANGGFHPVQVTDVVQTQTNGVQKREERISRDNGNGMALVEQSIRTETPSNSRSTVEVYRRDVSGVAPDSQLHLVTRQETGHTRLPDGSTETEQRESQIVPGSATNDLRVTRKTTVMSRPIAAGQWQTVTKIEAWDGNQGLRPVWLVDSKGARRVE